MALDDVTQAHRQGVPEADGPVEVRACQRAVVVERERCRAGFRFKRADDIPVVRIHECDRPTADSLANRQTPSLRLEGGTEAPRQRGIGPGRDTSGCAPDPRFGGRRRDEVGPGRRELDVHAPVPRLDSRRDRAGGDVPDDHSAGVANRGEPLPGPVEVYGVHTARVSVQPVPEFARGNVPQHDVPAPARRGDESAIGRPRHPADRHGSRPERRDAPDAPRKLVAAGLVAHGPSLAPRDGGVTPPARWRRSAGRASTSASTSAAPSSQASSVRSSGQKTATTTPAERASRLDRGPDLAG